MDAHKAAEEVLEMLKRVSAMPLEEAKKPIKGKTAKGKSAVKAQKGKKPPVKSKGAKKQRAAGHNPFKRQELNGPAVGPIIGPREVNKKTHWDCHKSGSYKQKCVNKETGKKKNIKIKPKYKAMYNKLYRKFISSGDKK